jgi:HlyD family secretion protein
MTLRRFFYLLGALTLVALAIYVATTPRGNAIELVGVVDGNDVVVSPQITGRLEKLNVDEGSAVRPGELIAELDPSELEAAVSSAQANTRTLASRVVQNERSLGWTEDQTGAQLDQAAATLTATRAQLKQAEANLWRDRLDFTRSQKLFESGVVSAQDRDHAQAAYQAGAAQVKSLEDQVKAQEAALGVAEANRKQVGVQESQLTASRDQLAQARADTEQAKTRLGYTRIVAPIGGIVSVRVAKQGEVVAGGAPIVVIVDVDHLWVRAEVEETYIDKIRFGERLPVRLPSGDMVEGTVFFKGVEGEFATQRDVSRTKRDIKTFAIKVAIPNPGHRLFTGMTATVLLPAPAGKSWFRRLLDRLERAPKQRGTR